MEVHFSLLFLQAVSLTAKQMGLGPLMRENRVLRSLVRSTLAIPLLPQRFMARGLASLIREANAAGLINILQPFFNYMIDTWMSPTFFRSLSVYGIRHRTNNVCESANKILRSFTGAHRPSLWHFICEFYILVNFACSVYLFWVRNHILKMDG